jgi:hypothetical protein
MTQMAENYPPAAAPLPPSEQLAPQPEQSSPADVVKDQAADLRQSGVEAGQHTASVARQQVSEVAAEATRQGRDLLAQAQQQAGDQVAQGQQRLASGLLSLGDELSSMADGSEQNGTAASLARQAATRVRGAGQWLDNHSPAQVADDVQAFARRRPVAFLALAAGVGLAAGRLTRGLKSAQSENSHGAVGTPHSGGGPGTADPWAASADTGLAEPVSGAGYPATLAKPADGAGYAMPPVLRSPEPAGAPTGQGYPYPDGAEEADVVVADDGSAAAPVVDGLPVSGAGSSWDVYPRADEQGTLGRHEAGGGDRQ